MQWLAPGAVVTKDVEANTVVAGVPAKLIKEHLKGNSRIRKIGKSKSEYIYR
jgi:serine acetyltransferase